MFKPSTCPGNRDRYTPRLATPAPRSIVVERDPGAWQSQAIVAGGHPANHGMMPPPLPSRLLPQRPTAAYAQ